MHINRPGPIAGMAASQQLEAKRNDADGPAPAGRTSHEKKPGAMAALKQALSRMAAALTGKEARTAVAAKSGSAVFSVRDFSRLEIALFTEAQLDQGPAKPSTVTASVNGPPAPTDVPVPPDAPPSLPRHHVRPPPTDTPPPLPGQTTWKAATPTKAAATAAPPKPVSSETRETQRKYDLDAQLNDLEAMVDKSQADRQIGSTQQQLDDIENDLQDLISSGKQDAAPPTVRGGGSA